MRGKSTAKEKPSSTNAIELLKTDHRKVEKLFSDFEAASTKREKLKLCKEMITELTVHATLEEKLVYPILLDEKEEEDATQEAYEEHSVVKNVLAELSTMSGSEENFKAKVKVLSELVKHHVKEEETELLPALKECGEDLDALGEKILAQKEKLMAKVSSKLKTISTRSKSTRTFSKTTASAKRKAS